jgi:hypothetical protein
MSTNILQPPFTILIIHMQRQQIGVVGLTLFDLRRLGKVDKLSMVGVSGRKFPQIRQHLTDNIGAVYKDMDTSCVIVILSGFEIFFFS